MAITISETDVREALGESGNTEDYPDSELNFPISAAEQLVNDELVPHSDDTERLRLVGAELAAAFAEETGAIESIRQADRTANFDTTDAMTHWRKAAMLDPTNRLKGLETDDFWFTTL